MSFSLAGFVLLLTPTGSLPTPRWRWWARPAATAGMVLLLAAVVDPRPLEPEDPGFHNPLPLPAPLAGPLAAAGAAGLGIALGTC